VFEDRAAKAGRVIPLKIVVLPALAASPAPDPIVVLAGGPGRDRGAPAQGAFGDLLPAEKIRACRRDLEKTADLRLYTTTIAMDDLDEVRAALGYEQINVWGVSYGSLAALQYLRQHPARVRSLALAGVATPAQKLPLQFAAGAQAALDVLVTDCAADHRAARGDWLPFARATRSSLGGRSLAVALGMYLTVTCSESVATISEDDIVRESRDTFVGEARTRRHVRACREWPRGAVPREFHAPVAAAAPVLMLSGERDPATPARDLGVGCIERLRRPPFATETDAAGLPRTPANPARPATVPGAQPEGREPDDD
jgi:pimeloyl-ACP methyl ester carboxylesterase